MSRLMIFLVLGLVAGVILARNVESEKEEEIEDAGKEEKDGEDRKKRMANNDFFEQEWNAFMNKQKMDPALKAQQKEVVAEFFAERRVSFVQNQPPQQRKCTCHVFKVDGVAKEKCFPEGCKLEDDKPGKEEAASE